MKRFSLYSVVVLLICPVLFAQDYRNPAVTSPTTPAAGNRSVTTPPSGSGSPTTPPSAYGSHTIPSRISESDFLIRNRIFGNYDSSFLYGGDSLSAIPQYETGDIAEIYTPLSDFMRRTTSNLYGYRSTRQTQSYYIPPQTSAYTTRDNQPTYAIPSRDYRTGLSASRPLQQSLSADDAYRRIQDDLFKALVPSRRRPLSSSPSRIQDYIEQTVQPELETEKLEETQAVEPKDESEYTHILEEYVDRPVEPVTPEDMDLLEDKVEDELEEKTPVEKRDATDPLLNLEEELQKEIDRIDPKTEEDKLQEQQELEKDDSLLNRFQNQRQQKQDQKTGETQEAETEAGPDFSHKQAQKLRDGRTFEEHMEYKYQQYIKAGRQYLRDKLYYKAADAFVVADFYKADQADTLLGRSHALFAAGEYMSSAYYLQKAIAIDPDKALQQVDLVEILGSRDTYDNRVVDLTNWTNRTRAPELALLSSYVLYTSNKLEQAQAAVTIAGEKMEDSPELMKLKQVIDKTISDSPF